MQMEIICESYDRYDPDDEGDSAEDFYHVYQSMDELHSVKKRYTISTNLLSMLRYILTSLLLLSSCSIGGNISDTVTDQRSTNLQIGSGATKPYEIGSVDTAFKFLGPDHKIEVG